MPAKLVYVLFLTGAKDIGQVVAIGTGNTMIPGSMRARDGRQVFDLHAVVIARRALLK